MKKTTQFFAMLFIFLFPQIMLAYTSATALAQYLNHFTTFQATFNQHTFGHHHEMLQNSQGTVALIRPGRFRWDTHSPSHQIVVTNGKLLWIYDIDLKQVTKQSLAQSGVDPAQLLSGRVHYLLAQFNVHILKKTNQSIAFQLIPKKNSQQFKSVVMIFENKKLSELDVMNSLNQTTIFKFSNIILNAPLNANLFNFKIPQGVDEL